MKLKKAQAEQMQKMIAQQRAEIERLQKDNEVLAKAVGSCSRSVDSILAVVTEQYGSGDEFGYTLILPEAAIEGALDVWEVSTERIEHNLAAGIRRREDVD